MRLILERGDILRILGEHLKQELSDDDITIRVDPFEVELRNIDASPASRPSALPARGGSHANEGPSEDEGVPEPELTEEDLKLMAEQDAALNEQIKREIDAKRRGGL